MKPDVVIHRGSSDEVVLLFEGLATQRWRPAALIGTTAPYGSSETAAMIGPSFDGTLAVGVVPYSADARLAPEASMIALLYEQRFGGQPRSGFSLSHFAGAALCFDVLRRAGSTDNDKVLSVARSLQLERGDLANGWGAQFGAGGQNLRAFPVFRNGRMGKPWRCCPPRVPRDATVRSDGGFSFTFSLMRAGARRGWQNSGDTHLG